MAGRGLLLASTVLMVMAARCGAQSDEELAALCSQIGVVPHPSECTKYVTCATGQGGFVARERSCGANLAFDRTSCVPISRISNCSAAISPVKTKSVLRADEDDCQGKFMSCRDCSTLRRCSRNVQGQFVNPRYTKCPEPTPHCSEGLCTATASHGCKAANFRCNDIAVFPDPTDCTNLFVCAGDETPYSTIICKTNPPSTLIASSVINDCIKSSTCPRVLCPANKVGFIEYPADSRFYIFCDPAQLQFKYDMYKCPGEQRFSIKDQLCSVSGSCVAAGKFANPNADALEDHFICDKAGATPQPAGCPTGLVFDQVNNRCEFPTHVKVCSFPNKEEKCLEPLPQLT